MMTREDLRLSLLIPKIQLEILSAALENISTQLTSVSEYLQEQSSLVYSDIERYLTSFSDEFSKIVDESLQNIQEKIGAFSKNTSQLINEITNKVKNNVTQKLDVILKEVSKKSQEYTSIISDIEKTLTTSSSRLDAIILNEINMFRSKLQNLQGDLERMTENLIDTFHEKTDTIINYIFLSIREINENVANLIRRHLDQLRNQIHLNIAKILEETRQMIGEKIEELSSKFSEMKPLTESLIDSITSDIIKTYETFTTNIAAQVDELIKGVETNFSMLSDQVVSKLHEISTKIERITRSIPSTDEIVNVILMKIDEILRQKETEFTTMLEQSLKEISQLSASVTDEMMKFYEILSNVLSNNVKTMIRDLKSMKERIQMQKKEFEIINEIIDSKLSSLETYIRQEIENVIISMSDQLKALYEPSKRSSKTTTTEKNETKKETAKSPETLSYQFRLVFNLLRNNLTQILSEITSKISETRETLKSIILENSNKILESIQNDLSRLSERSFPLPTTEEILDKIKPLVSTRVTKTTKALLEHRKALEKALKEIRRMIESSLRFKIEEIIMDIKEKLRESIKTLSTLEANVPELLNKIMPQISDNCKKFTEVSNKIISEQQNLVLSKINEFKNSISVNLDKIISHNRNFLNNFSTTFEQKIRQILDITVNEINEARKKSYEIFSNILDALEAKREHIKSEIDSTLVVPKDEILKQIDKAVSTLSSILDELKEKLSSTLRIQIKSVENLVKDVKADLSNIVTVNTQYIRDVMNSTKDTLINTASETSRELLSMLNTITANANKIATEIKENISNKIRDVVAEIKEKITEKTKNIVIELTSSYTKALAKDFVIGQRQLIDNVANMIKMTKDVLFIASENPRPLLDLLKQTKKDIRIFLITSKDILREIVLETKDISNIRLRELNIPFTIIFNEDQALLGRLTDKIIAIKVSDISQINELFKVVNQLIANSKKT